VNASCADEHHDPYCIAPDRATALLAQAPWRRLVVMGDGFARGPGRARPGYGAEPWADRLAAALRSVHGDLAYLNLAQRGSTAARMRARQLAKALTFQADLAAVAAGDSDVLGEFFDADATEAELARLIGPLREAGVEVLILAPFGTRRPARQPPEHQEVVRRRLRLLAERTYDLALRHGALHVDLGAHQVGADPDIYGTDGRQVDARGHAVAAATVIRRLGVHLGINEQRSHR
jgi:lysophospholipase L1-like esterase